MQRLIRILGSGRAVVLFGAGPSTEIGLPSWPNLVSKIVANVEQSQSIDLSALRDDIANDRLPLALGRVERAMSSRGVDGREVLEGLLKSLVADNNESGKLYSLMTQLPVPLFLSTNYDSAFERHLKARGVFPAVFTNTKESLELYETPRV